MAYFIGYLEFAYLGFLFWGICFILLALCGFGLLAHSTLEYLLRILNIQRITLHRILPLIYLGKSNKFIDITFQLLKLKGKEIDTFLPF